MNLQSLTFLVVEDMHLMRSVTINHLRALGCEKIQTARNGAEALQWLHAQEVDVVLSDWIMPVMTGLDLLRSMRATPKLARLPFLMITAETERQRIQEVIAAGVSSLLFKPYSACKLKTHLERMLTDSHRPDTPRQPGLSTVAEKNRPGADVQRPPLRILAVDDNPVSLKLLTHLLGNDYEVQTALNGELALALCQAPGAKLPDLVLMDALMPDMDGFEVVRRLREQAHTTQIPVIFVTGLSDDAAILKGMELGAVDFVTKHHDPRTMHSRLRNIIRFIDRCRHLQADCDAMLDATQLREETENMSRHDLKGSLAGIVGIMQGLVEDINLAPRQITQLHQVEQAAQQLMGMVNLSTELYKIENGHFKLKASPVDVGHILHRLAALSRSAFAEQQLHIVLEADTGEDATQPEAMGDAMLCYSLLQNLLKNACEAAPPGSRVTVTLKDENPLRILIQNTGTVAPALRERFFDKFASSDKPGGSGIGTYSARLLATVQHGDVSMSTSDHDNQTLVTITLPRHVCAALPTT